MATQPQPRLTLEEYLEQEQSSAVLHEFHGGEVWEIAAASPTHERLCLQVGAGLLQTFPECEVYGSKLSIYIELEDVAVYPDAVVVCGSPQTIAVKGSALAVTNPMLIVEVLSPSTQDYDRGFKSSAYRTIPSLRHLIFVAQDRILVEHLVREEPDRWSITTYRELHQTISLAHDSLSLATIYARVEFSR